MERALLAVAVDVVLLGIVDSALVVLLVRSVGEGVRGKHALPGVFVRADETLDAAASRALRDGAAMSRVFLEQLYTFGSVERDPRGRAIAVAYYALVDAVRFERAAREISATIGRVREAEDGNFTVVDDRGTLLEAAFDHGEIIAAAVRRIRGKLDYAPIGYELLQERFTLLQLQRVHETVAGRTFNKDSFRRKILASGLVVATSSVERDVGHRPAALYQYAVRRTEQPR